MKTMGLGSVLAAALLLCACTGKPRNITPVEHFDSARYLGTWYEIARLDHRFEQGLSRVTAAYSLREDGGIEVVNRGYKDAGGRWKEALGKAYFMERPDLGYLKVSFFGPFYGAYIVFDLDQDYRNSMVSGPDKSYLWLLSRTPSMDAQTKKRLLAKAQALGFDTSKLIFIEQGAPPAR